MTIKLQALFRWQSPQFSRKMKSLRNYLSFSHFAIICGTWLATEAQVISGGGIPSITAVTSEGYECENISIADVPQPYGLPGRVGALSGFSQDGALVICGGADSEGSPTSTFKDCQRLDLLTRTWSEISEMPELVAFAGSATVNNRLYSFGGQRTKNNGPGPTMYAYTNRIYSLDFNDIEAKWQESETRLPKNTSNLCAVPHGDLIYVIGAEISGAFHVDTEAWEDLPSLQQSNVGCEILTNEFNQSTLLAVGGSTGEQVWGLNLDTNATQPIWINMGIDIPSERSQGPSVSTLNNRLVVVGGSSESGDIELLTEFGWETVEGAMTDPRYAQSHVKAKASMFPECQTTTTY